MEWGVERVEKGGGDASKNSSATVYKTRCWSQRKGRVAMATDISRTNVAQKSFIYTTDYIFFLAGRNTYLL